MDAQTLEGGFERAPQDAAMAFRAAMTAMAHPGEIHTIECAKGPAPLSQAAASLILTLCDTETPVFLGASHDQKPVKDWITFHTGAPFTNKASAMFAIGTWDDLEVDDSYAIGSSQYPDRSATLIVEVPELSNHGTELRGPGIKDTASINHPDPAFAQRNRALFPLGIDMFLTCGERLAAIPRTTEVR